MNNKLSQIDSHTNSLFLEFFKRFKKSVSIHNFILMVTPLTEQEVSTNIWMNY